MDVMYSAIGTTGLQICPWLIDGYHTLSVLLDGFFGFVFVVSFSFILLSFVRLFSLLLFVGSLLLFCFCWLVVSAYLGLVCSIFFFLCLASWLT